MAATGSVAWCRPSRGGADRNNDHRDIDSHGDAAPHAGARIETLAHGRRGRRDLAAPHAGARIETRPGSHSPSIRSPPPLTRGRGSKHRNDRGAARRGASPLTRGRGSKRPPCAQPGIVRVAPHAGARIETASAWGASAASAGRRTLPPEQKAGLPPERFRDTEVISDPIGGIDNVAPGRIGAFYRGAAQFEYWQHTQLIIDGVPGRGSGFSLEAPEGRSRMFTDEEAALLAGSGAPAHGGE